MLSKLLVLYTQSAKEKELRGSKIQWSAMPLKDGLYADIQQGKSSGRCGVVTVTVLREIGRLMTSRKRS